MLTNDDQSYLLDLSRVNNILRILFAFGVHDEALEKWLKDPPRDPEPDGPDGPGKTRLDTKNSNIRGDTLKRLKKVIPPDAAKELSKHDQIRRRLTSIFQNTPSIAHMRKAKALNSCRQAHMLFLPRKLEKDPKTLIIPYACNARYCPSCSRVRSQRTFHRVLDTLGPIFEFSHPDLRWITLTMVNPPEGQLEQGLRDLSKAFSLLRCPRKMNGRRGKDYNSWTEAVDGYIWSVEVTHNAAKCSWHPHIHIIYAGDFIPWPELKADWTQALRACKRKGDIKIGTGYFRDESGEKFMILDKADGSKALGCLLEVCKYTLQPFESEIPAKPILELSDSIFNKRLFGSGGIFQLPPQQSRTDDVFWNLEGGLHKCLSDPNGWWTDDVYRSSILQSAMKSPSDWLRIVRNYDVFYWIQTALSHDESGIP